MTFLSGVLIGSGLMSFTASFIVSKREKEIARLRDAVERRDLVIIWFSELQQEWIAP